MPKIKTKEKMKYLDIIKILLKTIKSTLKEIKRYNKTVKLMTKNLPKGQRLYAESYEEKGDKIIVVYRRCKSFADFYDIHSKKN